MQLSLLSWNVNGIRARVKKGLASDISRLDPDIVCLQEVKCQEDQIPEEITSLGYSVHLNSATSKGYSGTMILSREKGRDASVGIGTNKFDSEGRVISMDLGYFYLINAYFPNSRRDLGRLQYKLEFNHAIAAWVDNLRRKKPVVLCGDLNVAHDEVDLARPGENLGNAGFTMEERQWMTQFLSSGYKDTFRLFNSLGGNYTWWSYMNGAREKNIGWRIDYFVVSSDMEKKVEDSRILKEHYCSDHVPVQLFISP